MEYELLENISQDKVCKALGASTQEESAEKHRALLLRDKARTCFALFDEPVQNLQDALFGYDAKILQDNQELSPGSIYLSSINGKIAYSVISPEGKDVRKKLTNIHLSGDFPSFIGNFSALQSVLDFAEQEGDIQSFLAKFELTGLFVQGNYEGRLFPTLFAKFGNDNLESIRKDSNIFNSIGFVYRDDAGTLCGVNILRLNTQPSKYAITLVKDITAAADKRSVVFICDKTVYQSLQFNKSFDSKAISASNISNTLEQRLHSKKMALLLKHLYKDGIFDDTQFDRLEKRMMPKNIDNRDERQKIFQQWLLIAREIGYENAEEQQRLAEEDPDFFEQTRFEHLLRNLLENAQTLNAQSQVALCHALWLRYQASFYNAATQTILKKSYITQAEEIEQAPENFCEQTLEALKAQCEKNAFLVEFSIKNDEIRVRLENDSIQYGKDEIAEFISHIETLSQTVSDKDTRLNMLKLMEGWKLFLSKPEQNFNYLISQYKENPSLNQDLSKLLKIKEMRKMQHLMNEADNIVKSSSQPTEFMFDPQGRVLFSIELSDEVSYDVERYPQLKTLYLAWIKEALEKTTDAHRVGTDSVSRPDADAIIQRLEHLPSKKSIISLQQELHEHLALSTRLYEKLLKKKRHASSDLVPAHQKTMKRVNQLIQQAFARALREANTCPRQDPDVDFIAKVNAVLDQACKTIVPKAHDILLEEIQKQSNHALTANDLNPKSLKHDAKKTTATQQNLLYIDHKKNMIIRIEGSNQTSHDRKPGTSFAHRAIQVYRTNEAGVCEDLLDRIWVRTPSLPVKEGLGREEDYIQDTQKKLAHAADTYQFKGSFTYNLFTALHHDDLDFKNLQTQSARHILLGAHRYNKVSYEATNPSKKRAFCYVQAISVNGHGRPLGYYSRNPFSGQRMGMRIDLQNEATLMSEVAMMRHVDLVSDHAKSVELLYQRFLGRPQPPKMIERIFGANSVYLCKTQEGRDIRTKLAEMKISWQRRSSINPSATSADFSKQALQKIMAFDLHFSHQHAKLIQALSLHLESQALLGCKSGNERTPIVCERALLLDQKDFLEKHPNVKRAFASLARATTKIDAKEAANQLSQALDAAYNFESTYGATTTIPLQDQGGGHKIRAKDGSIRSVFDTNYAEEHCVTTLCQDRTRDMQGHNKLVYFMAQAWERSQETSYIELDKKVDTDISDNSGSTLGVLSALGVEDRKPIKCHEDNAPPDSDEEAVATKASSPSKEGKADGADFRPQELDSEEEAKDSFLRTGYK